jgi:hypothetical protein
VPLGFTRIAAVRAFALVSGSLQSLLKVVNQVVVIDWLA